jgi:hypothetical protein
LLIPASRERRREIGTKANMMMEMSIGIGADDAPEGGT